MKKRFSKRLALRLLSVLLLSLLTISTLTACGTQKSSDRPLSPALDSIAEQSSMAKSALKGESIKFSADDFARYTNLSKIQQITITSLPPATDGTLTVGKTVLTAGQTLSSASLDLMTYTPSAGISLSEFKFRVEDSPYEMCCKLYSLDEQNYAPTLSVAPSTALEVSTYRNVTLYGKLPCYDPDGDQTYIEIVSYPQKGVLVMEDSSTGAYRYIPYEDSKGKDSFTYVARDMYGNYSSAAQVSLKINQKETPVSYVDLQSSPYHNSAIKMTECGIMSGTKVGNNTYFYPTHSVSRAEFTVMAMNASGITEVNSATATVFADDDLIPSHMKGYIAAAYELGYIKGSEIDGKLCFAPDKTITRAEAAVVLANILGAATPTIKPVFSDSDDIPTWAEASVNAMNYIGVLDTYEGNNISATSGVTRGDAAEMLARFMEVKNDK